MRRKTKVKTFGSKNVGVKNRDIMHLVGEDSVLKMNKSKVILAKKHENMANELSKHN